jgi:nuclear pore complex protein Nup62
VQLSALYNMVLAAEREQDEIDQALAHVEQQQQDLGAALDVYEKHADEVLGGPGGSLRALDTGPADTERDKKFGPSLLLLDIRPTDTTLGSYVLAAELHAQLQDLSGSLAQMVGAVNALAPAPTPAANGTEDAMGQIVQILGSHLESLQWIDGSVRDIEAKVSDVERRVRDAGGAGTGNGVRNAPR